MLYYQLSTPAGSHLVVQTENAVYDLTATRRGLQGYENLVVAADISGQQVDTLARELLDEDDELDADALSDGVQRPIVPDEVWAAGVTYEISEQAREEESTRADVYVDVYDAERPELFFKATPGRTVGPEDTVGIRGDSDWDVPEPELALVLYNGDIVGYTIGNDMSSRDLEGENPLYLPQAKIYDRCCSIGPCIASPSRIGDPHDLEISMEIYRGTETVFAGSTSTASMVRSCEELAATRSRHDAPSEFTVLLTGTSLVPPDEFTLQEGDRVEISVEAIGTLTNRVVTV
jgi:2-dehydro-3-deoxy-D-arabinonate dehydratase